MHKGKREEKIDGRGTVGKATVMGILERKAKPSRVKAKVVPNTKKGTLQAEVREHVEPGSAVYTDALKSYEGLADEYIHEAVDHAIEYVRGHVHTNGMENFWALFKRCIKGTHIHLSPEHLNRYVTEETFRFNERELNDGGRFRTVAGRYVGKRLTYKELIGKEDDLTPAQSE